MGNIGFPTTAIGGVKQLPLNKTNELAITNRTNTRLQPITHEPCQLVSVCSSHLCPRPRHNFVRLRNVAIPHNRQRCVATTRAHRKTNKKTEGGVARLDTHPTDHQCKGCRMMARGVRIKARGFRITARDFRITVRDFRIMVRDFRITVRGFRITVRDFRITVRDFRITVRGFRITVRGFRITVRDFRIMVRDFRITVRDFQITALDGRTEFEASPCVCSCLFGVVACSHVGLSRLHARQTGQHAKSGITNGDQAWVRARRVVLHAVSAVRRRRVHATHAIDR